MHEHKQLNFQRNQRNEMKACKNWPLNLIGIQWNDAKKSRVTDWIDESGEQNKRQWRASKIAFVSRLDCAQSMYGSNACKHAHDYVFFMFFFSRCISISINWSRIIAYGATAATNTTTTTVVKLRERAQSSSCWTQALHFFFHILQHNWRGECNEMWNFCIAMISNAYKKHKAKQKHHMEKSSIHLEIN